MDERDLPRLRADLYGLRIILARRQEAVANISQRVVEKEIEIAELEHALRLPGDGQPTRRYGSIRESIMRFLQAHMNGISSVEIGRKLNARLDGAIGAKTHLTTLKRLEAEGLARRAGRIWSLTSKGYESLENKRTLEPKKNTK